MGRRFAWALSLGVVAVLIAGGCGSDCNDLVIIPNAFQGTWMVAAMDSEDDLVGVDSFTVDEHGVVDLENPQLFVSGRVTQAGALTLRGTVDGDALRASGTMLLDDTGSGTWKTTDGGVQVNSGTFLVWRANGGAYAGIWDVTVAGDAAAAGPVTVDADGVVSGTLTFGGSQIAVAGVVTGSGTIVVAWSLNGGAPAYGAGPASGTASGSTASGSWQGGSSFSGTWTATKR